MVKFCHAMQMNNITKVATQVVVHTDYTTIIQQQFLGSWEHKSWPNCLQQAKLPQTFPESTYFSCQLSDVHKQSGSISQCS